MTRNVTQYDAMAHISSPGRISSSESVKGISGKIRKSPLVAGISSGISSRVAALLPSDAKTAATGLAAYADAGGFGHVEAVVESATLRLKRVDFSSHAAAESEICRMLANPAVRQLRFSDLKTLEERRFVASIVARNFPLLEVGRLIPGHSIANVSFSGIKKLNDRFGQEFVDHIIDAAKAFLQADFERTSGHDTANWRVVRDDYRNFTVSLPRGADPVKSLFWKSQTVTGFIDGVIERCWSDIDLLSKSRRMPSGKIISFIRRNFGISLGVSKVSEDGSDRAKLAAFREAELASKPIRHSGLVRPSVFDAKRTLELSKKAVAIERSIVREWAGKRFLMGGVEYPAVVEFRSEKVISPELLRTVRKNGHASGLVSPESLAKDVMGYLQALNSGFDFISPVRSDSDFAIASVLDGALRSGTVPKEAFLTTFKGASTKRAFYAKTEWRSGIRIYADIKDMGLLNFSSFRKAAVDVVAKNDGNDPSALLAGADVTRAFTDTVAEVRKKFPEAEIALGGDEILIFFPAESNVSEESAVSKVVAAISSHGLSSRIAHSHGTGGRETFASLDHSTSVHKAAEETFSKTVAFKGLFLIEPRAVITYGKVPDSFDPSNPAFVQAVGTLAKAGKGTTLFPISFGGFGTLSLEKGHLEIRFP